PAKPDIEAVREKERQIGEHGLPYVEVCDPFYTVCEMFTTELFYIKTLTEPETIELLLSTTAGRITAGIEELCREAGCPFILRLIGAEMAAPPFMSRENFLRFEGEFYKKVAAITRRYSVPASFHCHGPVRDIMNDIWEMGYSFIEPFEPPPRGNVTVSEALAAACGRGVVFGGIDEVLFTMGTKDELRKAVETCLDGARGTNAPYILAPSATPFYDPINSSAKENILLFMELGTKG
ncbi:MAG: uroporphyrinogen decarboxylase family protein, partial [Candidatus Latescibacterota bacterium]